MGTWENIAGLALVPILTWLICVGCGGLVTFAARTRPPLALSAGLGFCFATTLTLGLYELDVGDSLTIPALALATVAGLLLRRPTRAELTEARWVALAVVATYVVFNLCGIAGGHWTISGYNLNNDSAFELLLVARLQQHGVSVPPVAPSTANSFLRGYLSTGYPLGAQSVLGSVSGILGVSPAVAWQGFLAATAGVGTAAAACISGRRLGTRWAAVGFVAMASALCFQYAQQGSIKELGCLVTLLTALAVADRALTGVPARSSLALLAVACAGILNVFNAAGAPFIGAVLLWSALWFLVAGRQRPTLRWALPLGGAVLLFGILAAPGLASFGRFFQVARAAYGAAHPAAPQLGPLLRPLPLSEVSGIWLYGDYRFPVPPGLGAVLTVVATIGMFVLLPAGLLRALHRREPGLVIALLSVGLVLLVVYPRVSPYAGAKLFMIASPVVVLCALSFLYGWRRPAARVLGLAGAAALGAAILASDALAYHSFPLLPVDRMEALSQVGQRLGDRGPVLDSEFEQYAKFFTRPAEVIVGPEQSSPNGLVLRVGTVEYDHSFDLNQEKLRYVEKFPYLLTRRSPVASPPPANYRLIYANAFYEIWRRRSRPTILRHLPLGGTGLAPNRRAPCAAVRALVAGARPGARLAVMQLPPLTGFALATSAGLPHGWVPTGAGDSQLRMLTPGVVTNSVYLSTGGGYRAWVQGSFPRAVTVSVDGRSVGEARGSNTPGGWLSAGSIRLGRGWHRLTVSRAGGGPGPADGSPFATIGAVVLQRAGAPRLSTVAPSQWRSVCARAADWVELLSGA